MKKFLLSFSLLSITLTLLSCANSKNMASEKGDDSANDIQQVEVTEFATIQKTYCYGKCPVYKMTIYSDGKAVLEGKSNIEMTGVWETQLTKEELEKFILTAEKINYFDLEDKYDSPITDLPSTTTSIVIDGKRKEVYRRADYPQRILVFEEVFTDLLTNKKWVKTGELE